MTESSQGIAQTKELLKFVVELGMAVDKSLADKKVDITDIQFLMAPLASANAAFTDVSLVKAEMKDISAEEVAELVAFATGELKLASEKVEAVIETALKLGLDLYKYVQLFKTLKTA